MGKDTNKKTFFELIQEYKELCQKNAEEYRIFSMIMAGTEDQEAQNEKTKSFYFNAIAMLNKMDDLARNFELSPSFSTSGVEQTSAKVSEFVKTGKVELIPGDEELKVYSDAVESSEELFFEEDLPDEEPDIEVAEFDQKILRTFANSVKGDSLEFKNVVEALNRYKLGEGSASELYDACKVYTFTHDSNPWRNYGKDRFNGAAEIMSLICSQVAKENPEKIDEIKQDLKVNMLRSKTVRDKCIANMRNGMFSDIEGGKMKPEVYFKLSENERKIFDMQTEIYSFGNLSGKILQKEGNGKNISGKFNTPESRENLLDKYKGINNIAEYNLKIQMASSDMAARFNNAVHDLNFRKKFDNPSETAKLSIAAMLVLKDISDKVKEMPDNSEIADALSKRIKNAEQIIVDLANTEDFTRFYNSLSVEELENMAADVNVRNQIVGRYFDLKSLTPDEKLAYDSKHVEDVMTVNTDNYSIFFPNPDNDELKPLKTANIRLGLSSERTALTSLAYAVMLGKGYKLKDVFNPKMLRAEKLEAGKEVMGMMLNNKDVTDPEALKQKDKELGEYCLEKYMTGISKFENELNKIFKDDPKLSTKGLISPKYDYLYSALNMLNDMGQEINKPGSGSVSSYLTVDKKDEWDKLLNYQVGIVGCLNKGMTGLKTLVDTKYGNIQYENDEHLEEKTKDLLVAPLYVHFLDDGLEKVSNSKESVGENLKFGTETSNSIFMANNSPFVDNNYRNTSKKIEYNKWLERNFADFVLSTDTFQKNMKVEKGIVMEVENFDSILNTAFQNNIPKADKLNNVIDAENKAKTDALIFKSDKMRDNALNKAIVAIKKNDSEAAFLSVSEAIYLNDLKKQGRDYKSFNDGLSPKTVSNRSLEQLNQVKEFMKDQKNAQLINDVLEKKCSVDELANKINPVREKVNEAPVVNSPVV